MSSHPANLRVLFLGPLRERVGRAEIEVPFPDRGEQAGFWKALQTEFPALDLPSRSLRLARDHEFLSGSEVLRPGDKVAIIPPVSGG